MKENNNLTDCVKQYRFFMEFFLGEYKGMIPMQNNIDDTAWMNLNLAELLTRLQSGLPDGGHPSLSRLVRTVLTRLDEIEEMSTYLWAVKLCWYNCLNRPEADLFETLLAQVKIKMESTASPRLEALYHGIMAGYLQVQDDLAQATEEAETACQLFAREQMGEELSSTCFLLAGQYYRMGNYALAAQSIEKTIALGEVSSEQNLIRALTTASAIYLRMCDYDIALDCALRSLSMKEERQISTGMRITLLNLGMIYVELEASDKAREYYQRAMEIEDPSDDGRTIAKVYNNMGNLELAAGKADLALEYYKKSLALKEQLNDGLSTGYAYLNIGQMFLNELNDPEEAASYLRHASESFSSNGMFIEKTRVDINLAKVAFLRGQPEEAYRILADCLDRAKKYNNPGLLLETNQSLADLCSDTGDYQRAYEHMNGVVEYLKKLVNEEKLRAIQEAEAKYEVAKKNREAELFRVHNNQLINKNQLITEQNSRLEQLNDSLRELNATKDRFFSIIAHDLKGPFNAIELTTELLYNSFDEMDKEKQVKFLSNIHDNAVRVSNLLEELLTWARSQQGRTPFNPEPIDMHSISKATVNLLTEIADNKHIILSNKVIPGTLAYADSSMMATVVRNLISNAIKFTREGGEITVKCTQLADGMLEFCVSDNGVGIRSDDIDKLFKLDNKHTTLGTYQEKGTGLGLIICRDFVEKNGGTIRVESQEGKGSNFYFTMPCKSFPKI